MAFVMRDAKTGLPFDLELRPGDYVMEEMSRSGKRVKCAPGVMPMEMSFGFEEQ